MQLFDVDRTDTSDKQIIVINYFAQLLFYFLFLNGIKEKICFLYLNKKVNVNKIIFEKINLIYSFKK